MLEGTVECRTPDGTKTLAAGELVCFPSEARGACTRSSSRTGDGAAKALMWSSARLPAVAVCPDNDKIAVWPPNDVDEVDAAPRRRPRRLLRRRTHGLEKAGRGRWCRQSPARVGLGRPYAMP